MNLSIKKIDLAVVLENLDLCRPLLLPQGIALLHDPAPLIFFEARDSNTLVGLIMAKRFTENQTAQVYSWVVAERWRQRGIGYALFEALQSHLAHQEQCIALGFEYEEQTPSAIAIECILTRLGWFPPKLYLIRCTFVAATFNPPWMQKYASLKLPSEMGLFPWKELTASERTKILYQQNQGHFRPYLSPFRDEGSIEWVNSLGLRYRKEVIGWCITHRINPDTIRYSAFYIQNEFAIRGYAIWLLIQSIQQHKKSGIPIALFEANFEDTDHTWWLFVKKRLIPYADRVEKMKWALHYLR